MDEQSDQNNELLQTINVQTGLIRDRLLSNDSEISTIIPATTPEEPDYLQKKDFFKAIDDLKLNSEEILDNQKDLKKIILKDDVVDSSKDINLKQNIVEDKNLNDKNIETSNKGDTFSNTKIEEKNRPLQKVNNAEEDNSKNNNIILENDKIEEIEEKKTIVKNNNFKEASFPEDKKDNLKDSGINTNNNTDTINNKNIDNFVFEDTKLEEQVSKLKEVPNIFENSNEKPNLKVKNEKLSNEELPKFNEIKKEYSTNKTFNIQNENITDNKATNLNFNESYDVKKQAGNITNNVELNNSVQQQNDTKKEEPLATVNNLDKISEPGTNYELVKNNEVESAKTTLNKMLENGFNFNNPTEENLELTKDLNSDILVNLNSSINNLNKNVMSILNVLNSTTSMLGSIALNSKSTGESINNFITTSNNTNQETIFKTGGINSYRDSYRNPQAVNDLLGRSLNPNLAGVSYV